MTTKTKTTKVAASKSKGVPKECKLSQQEMETHISYDLVDKKFKAWTTIKRDITKFKTQGWELIKTEYYQDGTVYSATYEAPENAVTFRKLNSKRTMTEEKKEQLRQGRLAKKTDEPS